MVAHIIVIPSPNWTFGFGTSLGLGFGVGLRGLDLGLVLDNDDSKDSGNLLNFCDTYLLNCMSQKKMTRKTA